MMCKKTNVLMILLVLLALISASSANAKGNATSSVSNSSTSIKYAAEGKGRSATKSYKSSNIKIRFNGGSYEGFCIDPNRHLSASMNCGPLQSDGGLIYLVEQLHSGAYDHLTMQLAFRMYAVYTNMNKAVNNELSAAIVRYLQVKMGDQAVIQSYGSDPSNFLWGDSRIDTAYQLAYEAHMGHNFLPDGSETTGQASMLTFNKVGSTDTTVTYRVTSPSVIDSSKISFQCNGCEFVSQPTWNGTSGTLEVTASTEDCQFEIEAKYPSSGLYACSGYGENTQTILIDVQTQDEDGLATQVFEGELDSCIKDGEDCCTLEPITPGYMEGNINNCCTDDTHSEASEYDLNDLFCYSDELKVDHAYPKCNSDYYLNTDAALNDYCEMYCTERISVDLPGAITATSGRYFTLTTTQQGTKSPYIEGYKRCRILVHYDEWESDYGDAVQSQVDAYNDYQYNKAYELTYKDAIDNVKTGQQSSSSISCSCWYTYTATCTGYYDNGTSYTYDCDRPAKDTKSGSCNVTYDRYEFTKFYDYYGVKIDERYENSSLSGVYDRYEIVNDPNAKGRTTHSAWVADNIDTSSCDSTVSSMETWSGNCTYSCSRSTSEAENNREDVDGTYNSYVNSANAANSSFNAASDTAKKLEEDLYKCDNYFTEFEGADAEANYNLDVSMDFYYTQVYLDDYGEKVLDANYVDWSDEGCTIDGPITSPDNEISAPNYSSDYGTGTSTMNDFKNSTLDYHNSSTGYQNYIDETFEADRLFTHDAKYHGVCQWEEEQNQVNTLVPSGEASESTSEMNFTEHGREYRVYLTTFDGTYETHWNISGLGSDGKFDDYFLENGTTCAAENPADTSMFTCKLHVEHEVVLTGYCNGTLGTDTTTDPEDCDPLKEGYNLFTFKIVDPVNLFPSGTTVTEDGETKEIAYNWTSTAAGQQVMDEIQSTAADDETFSPSNLTYSFTVTPSDMQHIKNYNDQQDEEGGYSDFELNCSCPRNGDGTYAGPCVQCKSTFLENLANGIVRYDGANHQVTGWSNSSDSIQGIRNKNNW